MNRVPTRHQHHRAVTAPLPPRHGGRARPAVARIAARSSVRPPPRRQPTRRRFASASCSSRTASSRSTGGPRAAAATMELGPVLQAMMPHREDMVFVNGLFNQTAHVSTSPHLGRMNLLSGAPVSLDPNEIRVGTTMDQILAAADRQPDGDPEPRARHRAERAAPRRRPVDDLRLEPVVGHADQAGHQGDLSVARPSIGWSATASGRALDRSILDAVRQDSQSLRPKISRGDNAKLNEYFESIRDIEQRIERASPEERLEGWRPTLDTPDMPRPKNELPQNVPGSHEADARPDRPRVPDGQDARRDGHAQQRPVADELQVRRRRAGRAAPRSHAQRPRRRQGSDVPEDQSVPHRAVRLPDAADEGDLRRRDVAARQLDPDGGLEPVRRRRARRRTSCRSC